MTCKSKLCVVKQQGDNYTNFLSTLFYCARSEDQMRCTEIKTIEPNYRVEYYNVTTPVLVPHEYREDIISRIGLFFLIRHWGYVVELDVILYAVR